MKLIHKVVTICFYLSKNQFKKLIQTKHNLRKSISYIPKRNKTIEFGLKQEFFLKDIPK